MALLRIAAQRVAGIIATVSEVGGGAEIELHGVRVSISFPAIHASVAVGIAPAALPSVVRASASTAHVAVAISYKQLRAALDLGTNLGDSIVLSENVVISFNKSLTDAVVVTDETVKSIGKAAGGFQARFTLTQGLHYGDILDFESNAPYTLAAWLTPNYAGSSTAFLRFFSKHVTGPRNGWLIYLRDTGTGTRTVGWDHWVAGTFVGGVGDTSSSRYIDGLRFHIALTYNATDRIGRLYYNGELIATGASIPSDLLGNSGNLQIAVEGGSGYIGDMDDARIYSACLTDSEVAQVFADTYAPTSALEIRNKFDGDVADSSPHARVATLVGGGPTYFGPTDFVVALERLAMSVNKPLADSVTASDVFAPVIINGLVDGQQFNHRQVNG